MWQYIDYSPELYHHGIMGQKWGVRRFQNADGTLTDAGKKRYRVDSEGNLVEKTKQERKAEAAAAKQEKQEKQRQLRLEREKESHEEMKKRIMDSRDPALIYENKDIFSYQELSDLYNIMNKEKQISDMIPKAENFVDKMKKKTDKLEATTKYVKAGADFYDTIAKVSNSVLGTDLPRIKDVKADKDKDDDDDDEMKAMKKELEYHRTKFMIEQNKENLANLEKARAKAEQEAKEAKEDKKEDTEEKSQKETEEELKNMQKSFREYEKNKKKKGLGSK